MNNKKSNKGYTNKPRDWTDIILELIPLIIILGMILGIAYECVMR